MPRQRAALALVVLAAGWLSACAAKDAGGPAAAAEPAAGDHADPRTTDEIAAEVRSAMDQGADPCDDFYQYACGRWVGRTLLPTGESAWTRGIGAATDRARRRMRDVLEAGETRNAAEANLARFYRACMDDDGAMTTLRARLDAIKGSKRHSDFMREAARVIRAGAEPLMRLSVAPDRDAPGTMALYVRQGGLALPDLITYNSGDDQHRELLDAYRSHVRTMFELVGMAPKQAADASLSVVHFETALAGYLTEPSTKTVSGSLASFERLTTASLKKRVPFLPWQAFLEGLGHGAIDSFYVESPRHLGGIGLLLSRTPPTRLRAYLRWNLILAHAEHVPELAAAHHEFFGSRLRSTRAPAERWNRCMAAAESALPMVLGRAYVDRFYQPAQRDAALEIVDRVAEQLAGAAGESKLGALDKLIGHPTDWPASPTVTADAKNHLANVFAFAAAQIDVALGRVGKRVGDNVWAGSPMAASAARERTSNRVTVPAGLLQPPFFGEHQPDVMNFAGLGYTVGRELAQLLSDPPRAPCIADAYASEAVEAGVTLNGNRMAVAAEANHRGASSAHAAYRTWARAHNDNAPHVEGLTNERLFFVAFAQTQCTATTPQWLRRWARAGTSPPPPAVVNLPLASLPAFAEAFECAPGSEMNPKDRCEAR